MGLARDRPLRSMMVRGYHLLKILSVTCLLWTLTLCVWLSFSFSLCFVEVIVQIAHYFFSLMLPGRGGRLV